MSINATVQRIVDDLFADQLVTGLEATQKATWVSKTNQGYDPETGEVTLESNEQEINIIAGDLNKSFPAANNQADTSRAGALSSDESFVFQMQPLEGRTSKEALSDSLVHEGVEYMIKSVEVIRLGSRPMLWKVRAT